MTALAAALLAELDAQALDQLADALSPRLAERLTRPSESTPWLTVQQAADHLACRPQRIYNLVSQRRLRHVKDGSRVLFRRQWLDEYLEAGA
jgi:excisionase family DNA binding protein